LGFFFGNPIGFFRFLQSLWKHSHQKACLGLIQKTFSAQQLLIRLSGYLLPPIVFTYIFEVINLFGSQMWCLSDPKRIMGTPQSTTLVSLYTNDIKIITPYKHLLIEVSSTCGTNIEINRSTIKIHYDSKLIVLESSHQKVVSQKDRLVSKVRIGSPKDERYINEAPLEEIEFFHLRSFFYLFFPF
jgi:hypothetical protein